MQSCKNPETGIIGKCCRDPNYVDPWPQGPLPKNYNGGFDEKGFPTFLNLDKVAPPQRVKAPPSRKGDLVKRPTPFVPQQPIQSQAIDSVNVIPAFESRPTIQVTAPPRQELFEIHPQHSFPSSTFAPVHQVPLQQFPSTLAPVKSAPAVIVSTYQPASSTYQPIVSSTYRPIVSSTYKPTQSTYRVPEVVSSTYQPVSSTYRPVSTYESVTSTYSPVSTYTTPAPVYQSSPFKPAANNPFLTLSSTPAPIEDIDAVPEQEVIAIQPQAPIRFSPVPVTAAPTPIPVTFDRQYEVSPSHSAISILSQNRQPGQQCGLRNQVQRPQGLIDVDAAFGEIPWTAMVVSNAERKPFCSGAIISQNAVVTSASCLEG